MSETHHKFYGNHCYVKDLKNGTVSLRVEDCCGNPFMEKIFKTRDKAITFFRKRWGYEASPPLYYGDEGFDKRLKTELNKFHF